MPEASLKSLKFTALPKVEPLIGRRKKLVERLHEQKRLVDDPTVTRAVQRWSTQDGQRVMTEKKLKVSPWWRTDEKGATVFFVRVGWRAVEFEKGRPGVVVPSRDKLKEVIDVLIAATERGELDEVLA
jgi:hypothetical protein